MSRFCKKIVDGVACAMECTLKHYKYTYRKRQKSLNNFVSGSHAWADFTFFKLNYFSDFFIELPSKIYSVAA